MHVRVVTLDRPERRNALNHDTLVELLPAVTESIDGQSIDDVRVLALRGAAGHFCAGADLSGVEDAEFVGLLHGVLKALRDAPFPTLASVIA